MSCVFFSNPKTAYEVRISDWSSDVCSSDLERERLRMHPYYTERMLARPDALARLGASASLVRERCDGSGYPRGLTAATIPATARTLAAACSFRSEERRVVQECGGQCRFRGAPYHSIQKHNEPTTNIT